MPKIAGISKSTLEVTRIFGLRSSGAGDAPSNVEYTVWNFFVVASLRHENPAIHVASRQVHPREERGQEDQAMDAPAKGDYDWHGHQLSVLRMLECRIGMNVPSVDSIVTMGSDASHGD